MAREAIFIGYRREDTADAAGRIYDALAGRFGRRHIFKDVDNLRPGANFGESIRSILPRCRAMLALIGPKWIDARDENGRRRIDDPRDWVRMEIETALSTSGVMVVPVLINGARMPPEENFPRVCVRSYVSMPRLSGRTRIFDTTFRGWQMWSVAEQTEYFKPP